MIRIWTLLALLLSSTAHAERWVLIRPKAHDLGSERLAAELTDAIDRRLANRRGDERVGNILAADEAATVLDCLHLNENCAERAARAVNADGAIFATVRRAGARVLVELNQISIDRRRQLSWRIDLQGHRPTAVELGRLADALSAELLANGTAVRTGVFSDDRLRVTLDGRGRTIDGLLPLQPGSHRIVAAGKTMQIDLLPGEIVLLHRMRTRAKRVDDSPQPGGTQRTFGWLGVGIGAASMAAAGLIGVVHLGTVNEYQMAETRAAQRTARNAAQSEVMAMNTLLAVGGTAVVAGLILLLTD